MRVGMGDAGGEIVSASIMNCTDAQGNAIDCPGLPAGITTQSGGVTPTGSGPFSGGSGGAGFGPFSFLGLCNAQALANTKLCNSPVVGDFMWLLVAAGVAFLLLEAKH